MRRIIEADGIEILARVAKRRAVLGRLAREEQQARRKALRRHVRAECAARGISLGLLADVASATALERALSAGFVYSPDPTEQALIDSLRAQADEALPPTIRSERWATGDCQCVVDRIYHRDAPDDSQTVHAAPCPAHAGMAIDVLHDTLEEETQRRARVHRYLLDEQFPGADEVTFGWEGAGTARVLLVKLDGLSAEQRQAIVSFSDATFGAAIVRVP